MWVLVLLDKYAFYRPTHRLLEQLRLQGLDLAQGTLTDGLQRLLPLRHKRHQLLRFPSLSRTSSGPRATCI